MPATFAEYALSPNLTMEERVLVQVLRDYAIAKGTNLETGTSLFLNREHAGKPLLRTLSALSYLPAVRELSVCEHAVADLSPLQNCSLLERLELEDNQVNSLAPLIHCPELKRLNIKNNPVADLSPLACLSKLGELLLDSQQVEALKCLGELSSLRWLNTEHLHSFEALPNLPALRDLSCVTLGSLAGIGGFPRLKAIWCIKLEETSLESLRAATQLTDVCILTSDITNLEPLGELKALRKLTLCTNAPTLDLEPLRRLSALKEVDVLCQHEPVPGLEELKKKKKAT